MEKSGRAKKLTKDEVEMLFLPSLPKHKSRKWIREALQHVEGLLDYQTPCRNLQCPHCLFVINLMSSFQRRL